MDLTRVGAVQRSARWLLWAAVVTLAASHAAGVFQNSGDFFEGASFLVAGRGGWARPEWLTGPPYTLTPYAPGYFLLVSIAGRVMPWLEPLWAGRLLSLIAGLATAAIVGTVVGRRTSALEPGLFAAAIFLSYAGVTFWIQVFRVDALSTLLAVAAYATAATPAGLVWSAVLVVAGSLVKQTTILAAVPIALHLALTDRLRWSLRYLALVGVVAALAWGVVFAASSGYYFEMGVIGNRRTYSPDQALRLVGDFLRHWWTLAAALSLGLALWWNDRRSPSYRLAVATVVSWISAAILSGLEGASSNFFLEAAALSAVVIGIYGVGALWRRQPLLTSAALCVMSVALTASGVSGYIAVNRDRRPIPDLTGFRHALSNRSVLADWQYIMPALRAGLEPAVNDPFFLTVAARNGAFPIDRLLDQVRAGEIAGLVLNASPSNPGVLSSWPPQLVSEFQSRFEPAGEVGGAHLYRFRQP